MVSVDVKQSVFYFMSVHSKVISEGKATQTKNSRRRERSDSNGTRLLAPKLGAHGFSL